MSTYAQRKHNAVTGTGTLRHFEDLAQMTTADWSQRLKCSAADNQSMAPVQPLQANRDLYFYRVPLEESVRELQPDVCKHVLDNRRVFSLPHKQ